MGLRTVLPLLLLDLLLVVGFCPEKSFCQY